MANQTADRGRSRLRRILWLMLTVIILLPVIAVVAFVATFDPESYKPRIVAAIHEATGRDLALNGPIHLKLSLNPTLAVDDVSLANPPGFSRPSMLMLKRLELQVALRPLLGHRLEIERIVLDHPDILLERDAKGGVNWNFVPPAPPALASGATSPPAAPPAPVPPVATREPPAPGASVEQVILRDLRVADGRLAYRDGKTGVVTGLELTKLSLRNDGPDTPLQVQAEAKYDGAPFALAGRLGSLEALLEPAATKAAFPMDLTVEAAGARLSLRGAVGDLAGLRGVDLRLAAQAPDLAALSPLAHVALPALRTVELHARVRDSGHGLASGVALAEVKLSSSAVDVDGTLTVLPGPHPGLTGTLHAGRLDLDAFPGALPPPAPVTGKMLPAMPPPSQPSPAATGPARLIPDDALAFDALRAADMDLHFTVGALVKDGVTYRDLAGHALLRNGRLKLDPFVATIPGGKAQLSLSVDASASPPRVAYTLLAPALLVEQFLAAYHMPVYVRGALWLSSEGKGAGRSPHQIAATLDGATGIAMENAEVDTALLGGLLQEAPGLKQGGGGLGAMRCLALRLETRQGAGDMRALLLEAAAARISGGGGVNLGQETLALRLNSTVRMGGAGVSAPVDVRGSFLAPRVAIDAARALAGAAGAAAGANAGAMQQFGIIIGKLGADRLIQGAGDGGETCERQLAIAHGAAVPPLPAPASPPGASPPGTPPPSGAAAPAPKPMKPADLLRQLFR